jgi:hypothetical protein
MTATMPKANKQEAIKDQRVIAISLGMVTQVRTHFRVPIDRGQP